MLRTSGSAITRQVSNSSAYRVRINSDSSRSTSRARPPILRKPSASPMYRLPPDRRQVAGERVGERPAGVEQRRVRGATQLGLFEVALGREAADPEETVGLADVREAPDPADEAQARQPAPRRRHQRDRGPR